MVPSLYLGFRGKGNRSKLTPEFSQGESGKWDGIDIQNHCKNRPKGDLDGANDFPSGDRDRGGHHGKNNLFLHSEELSQTDEVGCCDRARKDHRVLSADQKVSLADVLGGSP